MINTSGAIRMIRAAGFKHIGTNTIGIWFNAPNGSTHLIEPEQRVPSRGYSKQKIEKKLLKLKK